MSLKSLIWAIEEADIYCPSEKLILIALANFSNENGRTYPAVDTVCRITKLSDNTVRRCLKKLEDDLIIFDTKKRYGPTQQVKVWQLPDAAWKTEDHRGGGLQNSKDPLKTPRRPPEDPHGGEQSLEPVTSNLKTPVASAPGSLEELLGSRGERHGSKEQKKKPEQTMAKGEHRKFTDGWVAGYKEKFGHPYFFSVKDGAASARLMKIMKADEALRIAKAAWSQTDEKKFWSCVHHGRDIPRFTSSINAIQRELSFKANRPEPKIAY